MLQVGKDEYLRQVQCLQKAVKLLESATVSVEDDGASLEKKTVVVNSKVKLAYAWMDLAQKI